MAFGIFVYESSRGVYLFIMADDFIYDRMKKDMHLYGMKFLNGRKGIPDGEIDDVSKRVRDVVKRKKDGEKIDLNKELELILN